MKRNVKMSEISDGNLYTANDMVKADCQDCQGCSACCKEMGNSIQLDPYDIWQLSCGLSKSFEELIESGWVELGVTDGIILPYLKSEGACPFLNEEGRCTIHAFRPGICRLFPLGRYYEEEEDGFYYFLQIHECQKKDRTKVKVKKWLGISNLKQYEQYINSWHRLLKNVQIALGDLKREEQGILQTYLLRTFYQTPYSEKKGSLEMTEIFYDAFLKRRLMTKEKLGL